MNLYKITQEFHEAINALVSLKDNEDNDTNSTISPEVFFINWINESRDNLDSKRIAVGAYIKNQIADLESLSESISSLKKRYKSKKNKINYLESTLLNSMISTDTKEVKGVEFDLKIKESWYVDPFDTSIISDKYFVKKISMEVDKMTIKNEIKSGKYVPGAKLSVRYSMNIFVSRNKKNISPEDRND